MVTIRRRLMYFLDAGSLHGVRYLGVRCTLPGKLTWLTVLAISAWTMWNIFEQTLVSFESAAISINIDSSFLHWNNTFPAVTVCFAKGRSTTALKNYFVEYWKTQNVMKPTKVMSFIKLVQSYLFINPNNLISTDDDYCGRQNSTCGVDFDALRDIFFPKNCSSFMSSVMYLGVARNCEDIFLPQLNEMGTCFTANSLNLVGGDGHKLPLRYSSRSSELRQLSFKYQDLEYISLVLYVHSPDEQPYFHANYFPLMKSDVHHYLAFDTIEIMNGHEVPDEAVAKRHCRFPSEQLPGCNQMYSFSACFFCLRIRIELEICNCTIPTSPPEYRDRYCDYEGLKCIKDHGVNAKTKALHYETATACDQSCVEMEVNEVGKSDEVQSTNGELASVTLEIINVPAVRYARNVDKSRLDLVVSIGGVAGLFFGASLLSIVEVIYIFFVRKMK